MGAVQCRRESSRHLAGSMHEIETIARGRLLMKWRMSTIARLDTTGDSPNWTKEYLRTEAKRTYSLSCFTNIAPYGISPEFRGQDCPNVSASCKQRVEFCLLIGSHSYTPPPSLVPNLLLAKLVWEQDYPPTQIGLSSIYQHRSMLKQKARCLL